MRRDDIQTPMICNRVLQVEQNGKNDDLQQHDVPIMLLLSCQWW
jgi:hypothetical protein